MAKNNAESLASRSQNVGQGATSSDYVIHHGLCIDVMRTFEADSIDALVSDPPYGLKFQGAVFDDLGEGPQQREWHRQWAVEALRVLKPGAYALAFSGTRTYHHLASGLEDAGFEILGQVDWYYATGMPKGGNLKPCHEPVVVARKPFKGTRAANVDKHGVGAMFADRCRTPRAGAEGRWPGDVLLTHSPACKRVGERKVSTSGYWADTKVTGYGKTYEYFGTGERPKGTVVADWECTPDCPYRVLSGYGCGAGKKRASETAGDYFLNTSWELEQAANRAALAEDLDGLPIEAVLAGDEPSFLFAAKPGAKEKNAGLEHRTDVLVGRSGGAKTAAAKGRSYEGKGGFNRVTPRKNTHPTVKPIAIMTWLLKLVMPEGGVVCDPFCGSGSTGCAVAVQNNDPQFSAGWKFIGIEADFESHGFHEQATERIQRWANSSEPVELVVHPSGPACQAETKRELAEKERLKAERAPSRASKRLDKATVAPKAGSVR